MLLTFSSNYLFKNSWSLSTSTGSDWIIYLGIVESLAIPSGVLSRVSFIRGETCVGYYSELLITLPLLLLRILDSRAFWKAILLLSFFMLTRISGLYPPLYFKFLPLNSWSCSTCYCVSIFFKYNIWRTFTY